MAKSVTDVRYAVVDAVRENSPAGRLASVQRAQVERCCRDLGVGEVGSQRVGILDKEPRGPVRRPQPSLGRGFYT